MSNFYEIEPTLENYWRSIILFGRNVASYKFALAKSLYELNENSNDIVTMEDLAEPFSRHLCSHLTHSPKQITSKSSKFLNSCNDFNENKITKDQLVSTTIRLGFNNVIDAFHVVNSQVLPQRFFLDERKESGGIRLTDNYYNLVNTGQFVNFSNETEARWRLVEEAWELGISKNLITVNYDQKNGVLFTDSKARRVDVTSCRDSLNGYQKSRCFYCHKQITTVSKAENLGDVDHFLPWTLNDKIANINGVWNLVLACKDCNRGEGGKFARVPTVKLLERLHKRNEYFINSHLPLRETLIRQTGKNKSIRISFLQNQYDLAKRILIHSWEPKILGESIF